MPLTDGQLTGTYRRLLIAHDELPTEAARLAPRLRLLGHLHKAGSLSDAEFAFWFVLLFTHERTQKLRVSRAQGVLAAKLDWLNNEDVPPPRAMDAILKLNAFGMPGLFWQALSDWLQGKLPLRLTSSPPTAHQMLHCQAEGARIVTLDLDAAIAGKPVAATRDAFEFTLHDLGHAYSFYLPAYQPQAQVQFFNRLQHDLTKLESLAAADTKFAADLEYCMADMNTHPEHLRQYLRGVIVEAFYRLRKSASPAEYSEAGLAEYLTTLCCV